MVLCKADIGKVNETTIKLPMSKGNPAVGTARRTDPSKGGTTGPTSIFITKI